jgi:hypothetical protein
MVLEVALGRMDGVIFSRGALRSCAARLPSRTLPAQTIPGRVISDCRDRRFNPRPVS